MIRVALVLTLLPLFTVASYSQRTNRGISAGASCDDDFAEETFDSVARFDGCRFHEAAFNKAVFRQASRFREARFESTSTFASARFHGPANFRRVRFQKDALFSHTQFRSEAIFEDATFSTMTVFLGAEFMDRVTFNSAEIGEGMILHSAVIRHLADFRWIKFEKGPIDFTRARVMDSLLIGSEKERPQQYDFRLAELIPPEAIPAFSAAANDSNFIAPSHGARIVLYGPVDMDIQYAKIFEYVSLPETLDYYRKAFIVGGTNQISFKDESDVRERYEMNYLLARSTMYQKQSSKFEEYSAFNPISWGAYLFEITMGSGFRPFRLVYWALGVIGCFGLFYFLRMPIEIDGYLAKDDQAIRPSNGAEGMNVGRIDTLINCVYLSATLFFTFRLQKDILTSFSGWKKRILVAEWLLGFAAYAAFVTLSESGSILHTLKSLFEG